MLELFILKKTVSLMIDNPVCPIHGCEVVRVMSISSIRFKGSGFHCTDYTRYGHVKKSGKGVV